MGFRATHKKAQIQTVIQEIYCLAYIHALHCPYLKSGRKQTPLFDRFQICIMALS